MGSKMLSFSISILFWLSVSDIVLSEFHSINLGSTTAAGGNSVKGPDIAEPKKYEESAGGSGKLRCKEPPADYVRSHGAQWLLNGRPLSGQGDAVFGHYRVASTDDMGESFLHVSALVPGEYRVTCVRGELSRQIVLVVKDNSVMNPTTAISKLPDSPVTYKLPAAPVITRSMCLGNRTQGRIAVLLWKPTEDRAPVLHFSIQYKTSFAPDTWHTARDNLHPELTMQPVDLNPGVNYTFRMVAWNDIGSSDPSEVTAECSTDPDVPYKNPENVTGKGLNKLVISWSKMPQIEHNGPGFHYVISWKRDFTGMHKGDMDEEREEEVKVFDWTVTQLVVPDADHFKPYKIKVEAVNSIGRAKVAPVEVIGWSGEDVPLQAPANFTLQQFASGTTALLSWYPVPEESVRGPFRGYRIQTWTDGEEDRPKEILVTADATSALVSKFKPYKKNYAKILAYNGRFNGPASEALVFVTPEGTPGPVKSFQAHPISSSELLLEWEKPVDENGILTGYKIYYQKVQGTALGPQQERKKEIDPKFDRAKLAGLEPNTKYRVEIRAKTMAGEGEGYYVEQTTEGVVSNTKYRFDIRAKTKAGEGEKYYVGQTTEGVVNAETEKIFKILLLAVH